MFIRKTVSTNKNTGKIYENYLLVESVHTPKGPRQRTVCSLGNLEPRPRSQWLKLAHKVEEALVGQGELFEDSQDEEVRAIVAKVKAGRARTPRDEEVVEVVTGEAKTEEHRQAGPVHVGHAFWKRLGLDAILAEQGLGPRTRTLACAMALNRLVAPRSEHAMPGWIRSTALPEMLGEDFSGLSEDALYRTMDQLYPHRAAIESALAQREAEVFHLDQTVFVYDVTSTYFEGLASKNPKAQRGYSRDKRPDCKQVMVGLAVNRAGFPLAHEVLKGNTQDRTTLSGMLELLDARVGLREGQTVVVDRGMAYAENIETLRTHPKNLHYIAATRQSERDRFLADFEDLEEFEEVLPTPSPANAHQQKSRIRLKRVRREGETYILCVSSERAEPVPAKAGKGPRHPGNPGTPPAQGSRGPGQTHRQPPPGPARQACARESG